MIIMAKRIDNDDIHSDDFITLSYPINPISQIHLEGCCVFSGQKIWTEIEV